MTAALPLRPTGRRGTVLPPQSIPATTVQPSSTWSHRMDRIAAAMAEKDGWVWKNLDQKRREYWRSLAAEAIVVMEDV